MSGSTRLVRAGSGAIAAVFVLALVLSVAHGHQRSLPSVALGWPVLLYLERAIAATAVVLAIVVVLANLLRGELPSRLSTSGFEWPAAVAPDRATLDAAVNALAEIRSALQTQSAAAGTEQAAESLDRVNAAVEESELRRAIADAISELSETQRLVISLHYYESMSDREIGEYLERPARWVAAQRNSAVRQLRQKLGGIDPETVIGDD